MELISPSFRLSFREFCVGLYLQQINEIFQTAGIPLGKLTTGYIGSERRTLAARYLASIDWTNMQDVQKFLKAIENVLSQSYIFEGDKAALRNLCSEEGLVVDGATVRLGGTGAGVRIKNLIFAADGPKPEIVLVDSTTNEIRIVKNEQYCLVYDRPVLRHGLLWKELVEWWREKDRAQSSEKAEGALYERLYRSLSGGPEKVMFNTYFVQFRHLLGAKLPALIPQVYLHYDPYTIRQLGGVKRLSRQRMDFLMLLSNDERVVIEIDGMQHYSSKDGQAKPQLYADMVAEDRRLRLAGYEVYRFGGYEFIEPSRATETIRAFFDELFERYSVAA